MKDKNTVSKEAKNDEHHKHVRSDVLHDFVEKNRIDSRLLEKSEPVKKFEPHSRLDSLDKQKLDPCWHLRIVLIDLEYSVLNPVGDAEDQIYRLTQDKEKIQHVPDIGVVKLERGAEARETPILQFALMIPDVLELQVLLKGVVGPAEGHERATTPKDCVWHPLTHQVVFTLHLVEVEYESGAEVNEEWNEASFYDSFSAAWIVRIEESSQDLVSKDRFKLLFFDASHALPKPAIVLIHEV